VVSTNIVRDFPAPTKLLASAFAQLQIARSDDEEAKKALGALSELARPWDPASCPPLLRKELWVWLDGVVGWLNHEYTWQADRVIPSCWPAHPHIVHEIAVLACLRLSAGHALTADAMEDWHRYVVPGFFDRMLARLGGSPCQPGSHKAWPGASRFTDYESPGAVSKRLEAFEKDTSKRNGSPPPPPHRNGSRPTRTALSVVAPTDPDERSTP
jgi:hypothetical protein